jgi:hypothetical protein
MYGYLILRRFEFGLDFLAVCLFGKEWVWWSSREEKFLILSLLSPCRIVIRLASEYLSGETMLGGVW